MGRPSKILDVKCRERLLEAIRAGNYYEPACTSAGICYFTMRGWVLRGEAEQTRLAGDPKTKIKKKEQPYVEFLEALRQAEAEAEIAIVQAWRAKCPESPTACREMLERRYPGRWGRRERHEFTGKDGGPIEHHLEHEVDYSGLSDEELRQLIRDESKS